MKIHYNNHFIEEKCNGKLQQTSTSTGILAIKEHAMEINHTTDQWSAGLHKSFMDYQVNLVALTTEEGMHVNKA